MPVLRVRAVGEQRGVLQQRLAHHHAVDTRLRHAPVGVRATRHAAVREHRNVQVIAQLADRRPVAAPHALLVLLARAPVDLRLTAGKRPNGDELRTFSLQHQAQLQRVLHLRQEADLRRERDPHLLAVQRLRNALDAVIVRKQVRAVLSLSGNALRSSPKKQVYLRTAQIQVDRVAAFCKVDGRLLQHLGVVAAQLAFTRKESDHLDNQWTVFRTRLEALLQVACVLEHDAGVIHLRVAQIDAVLPDKQSVCQVALFHL